MHALPNPPSVYLYACVYTSLRSWSNVAGGAVQMHFLQNLRAKTFTLACECVHVPSVEALFSGYISRRPSVCIVKQPCARSHRQDVRIRSRSENVRISSRSEVALYIHSFSIDFSFRWQGGSNVLVAIVLMHLLLHAYSHTHVSEI